MTARTRTPHVRDAVADRELTTWLVVDLSASVDFGTAGCTKRDLVVTAAGAWPLASPRQPGGALLLTTGGVATLPPRSGHLHLMALLHRVLTAPRADGTGPDLSAALGRLAWPPARPGLVVVVSDFPAGGTWVPACGWRRPATRRWRWRSSIRGAGPGGRGCWWWPIRDREQREVATGDAGLRRRYAALARERRAATAATLRGRVSTTWCCAPTGTRPPTWSAGWRGAPPGWPGCAGTAPRIPRGGGGW